MDYILWIRQLVEKTGKTLKEVFATIPGSMTAYRKQIREMLKSSPPDVLGAHKYSYVEDVLIDQPNQVVIECTDTNYERRYFLLEITADANGNLAWGKGEEIEVQAVIQHKTGMAEMVAFVESAPVPRQDLTETADVDVTVDEANRKAVVTIAQKADAINRNNRLYPAAVLKPAVEEAQRFIDEHGSMPMAGMHETERNVVGTCAIIKKIAFDEKTGIVSLPEVEILNTSAGKDILEMLKHKDIKFQVSQRGYGMSHTEADASGKTFTQVDWLKIVGFDLTWSGEASVIEADFRLIEDGSAGNPQPTSVIPRPGGAPQAPGAPQPGNPSLPVTGVSPEMLEKAVSSALAPFQQQLQRSQEHLDAEVQRVRKNEFVNQAGLYLDSKFAELGGFDSDQKAKIKSRIDLESCFEKYSPQDPTSLGRVVDAVFEKEIEYASEFIAKRIVDRWGMPAATPNSPIVNRYGGLQYDEFLSDLNQIPGLDAHFVDKVVETTIKQLTRDHPQHWVMDRKDAIKMAPLAKIMDNFVQANEAMLLTEAQQSGMAVPFSITSMYIVMVAWRLTTAFQVAQMHPMMSVLENIPVEVWTGAHSNVPSIEKYSAINVGESVAIDESVFSVRNYPLAAGYQPQRTRVTPYAIAVTKNTVVEPVARSIGLPARELRDLTDTMLWNIMIMETLKSGAVEVATAVNLTRIGTSNSWQVPHRWLIPYEWSIRKDANQNVNKVGFRKLWPEDGAATMATSNVGPITLTPMILTDDNSSQPTGGYRYNTDWTIDWKTGIVTLTSAGETKRDRSSGDHTLKLTYSYNRVNMFEWNAQPSSGMKFIDHLLDFGASLADAKTRITDQHYTPECLCWNYELQEKIVLSSRFTRDGSNEANAINATNEAVRVSGLDPIWSTAILKEFAIVQEKMSTLYGVQTPYTISEKQIVDETGDEQYFAKQFTGAGVPEPAKLSLVAIRNLDKIATPA